MKITRKDAPNTSIAGGTVTTNGPATGLQNNAAAVAIGVPDKTYVLKETAKSGTTALANYDTTLECVDKTHGNAPVPVTRVGQGEYELNFQQVPNNDGQLLANVVCTYTNTPNGTLDLSKELDGDRADDADQFRVRILASPSKAVAKTVTNQDAIATTTGTGDEILTGTTEKVRAQTVVNSSTKEQSTQAYTFDELGWKGGKQTDSVLDNYPNATLSCTDSAGIQPADDLPDGMLLADFTSITPKPGAQISCVITNSAGNSQFHVEKLGQNCDVSAATCNLDGAEFALYDTDPSAAGAMPIIDGISADPDDGSVFISKKLPKGTYWVVETKAPDGFTLLPEPIQLTLTSEGITLAKPDSGLAVVKDGDALTIQVFDVTPAPLPEAGGPGHSLFYAVGLLLLAAGGLYYQMTSGRRAIPLRTRS